MTRLTESIDAVLQRASGLAGVNAYTEIPEKQLILSLAEAGRSQTDAAELVEIATLAMRAKAVIRDGRVFEWNLFRSVLCITRLPAPDELRRLADFYAASTPGELERRLRTLPGTKFERFLGDLLALIPGFEEVGVTQVSRDGGIDFQGWYRLNPRGPRLRLLGQAKQVGAPISARDARDFLGALDSARERKLMGVFVSTSGFTKPALEAFANSQYQVWTWDMEEILRRIDETGLGIKPLDFTIKALDDTYWDEI